MKQKLPAYPLFVKDPFFSIWSKSDILNADDTMFWNGKTSRTYGLVHANGNTYCFLGKLCGAQPLQQTDISIDLFSTKYSFTCLDFDLQVSFISPSPLSDLTLTACPICYLSYDLQPKKTLENASIVLILDEDNLYSHEQKEIKGGAFKLGGYEAAYFGLRRQLPLSHSYDSVNAEWGYSYLAADTCMYCSKTALNKYIFTGEIEYNLEREERKYLFGANIIDSNHTSGKIVLAFDDLISIFYFGEYLKGYYFEDGKTIFTALDYAVNSYAQILTQLSDFQNMVKCDAAPYGEKYWHILCASYRQSMGSHKLVKDREGNLLFLSKECNSNGCIATVDITYPSCPLMLAYNPQLIDAMLRPIFKFAQMPIWQYEYAPHDVGTYPYCLGQTYSIWENDDKYHAKSIFFIPDKREENYPMFYQFPANSNIYTEKYQMPVEECSNMLILTAAAMRATKNFELAKLNLPLLKKWCEYLIQNGLIPQNQPCTDDFAEKLDKNVNLSVKAIVGIGAYGIILNLIGEEDGKKYLAVARDYAKKWEQMTEKFTHSPITFDSGEDTFSIKYNLAFDILFGTNLFSLEIIEKELSCYTTKANKYGIPLDSRNTYTKSDWMMWAAVLSNNTPLRQQVIDTLYEFLTNSRSRVPFTDFFDTISGEQKEFQNRTVQGAMFILILKDKGLLKI